MGNSFYSHNPSIECFVPHGTHHLRGMFFISFRDTKDLRQASLLIIPDINKIPRKHQLMAALFGKVILSAAILQGGNGVKLSYHAGIERGGVFVYVTDRFRNEEPGLTMILREACAHGWKAVTMDILQARSKGPKNFCLFLRARGEILQRQSRIQCLDGNELVAWAAKKIIDTKSSAWISGRDK